MDNVDSDKLSYKLIQLFVNYCDDNIERVENVDFKIECVASFAFLLDFYSHFFGTSLKSIFDTMMGFITISNNLTSDVKNDHKTDPGIISTH